MIMHETRTQKIKNGRTLRKLRYTARLSVKGLMTLCQISRTTLHDIEAGNYTINYTSVHRICAAFGIDYYQLPLIKITPSFIKAQDKAIKSYMKQKGLSPAIIKEISEDRKAFRKPAALIDILLENKFLNQARTVEEIQTAITAFNGTACRLNSLLAALQNHKKIKISKSSTLRKNLYKQK